MEGFMCDTSLVCEDGVVRVHGIVMSAASRVIQSSLRQHVLQAEHVLVFPGVSVSLMNIAVQFAYSGELLIPVNFNCDSGISNVIHLLNELELTLSQTFVRAAESCLEASTTDHPRISSFQDESVLPVLKLSEIDTSNASLVCCDTNDTTVITSSNVSLEQTGLLIGTEENEIIPDDSSTSDSRDPVQNNSPVTKKTNTERKEKTFECTLCGNIYHSAWGFRAHQRTHSNPPPVHRCDQCDVVCSTRHSLLRHLKQHTGERPFLCQYCGQGFIVKERMLDHVYRNHGDIAGPGTSPFRCRKCSEVFLRSKDLWCHNKYFCKNRTDTSARSKLRRAKANSNKITATTVSESFECDVCRKVLVSHLQLAIHNRQHAEGPGAAYRCPVCEDPFLLIKLLHQHLVEAHNIKTPFVCEFCCRDFVSSQALYTHRRSYHLKRDSLSCSTCDKVFQSHAQLVDHERIHSDEKPFHCETCNQDLRTIRELQYHKFVHSAKPLHTCETCGKSFITKNRLAFHQYSHDVSRPHECSICGQRFCLSFHLKRHMRIHTGERPFGCSECTKAYKTRHDLRLHMKSVHQLDLSWMSVRIKQSNDQSDERLNFDATDY